MPSDFTRSGEDSWSKREPERGGEVSLSEAIPHWCVGMWGHLACPCQKFTWSESNIHRPCVLHANILIYSGILGPNWNKCLCSVFGLLIGLSKTFSSAGTRITTPCARHWFSEIYKSACFEVKLADWRVGIVEEEGIEIIFSSPWKLHIWTMGFKTSLFQNGAKTNR